MGARLAAYPDPFEHAGLLQLSKPCCEPVALLHAEHGRISTSRFPMLVGGGRAFGA